MKGIAPEIMMGVGVTADLARRHMVIACSAHYSAAYRLPLTEELHRDVAEQPPLQARRVVIADLQETISPEHGEIEWFKRPIGIGNRSTYEGVDSCPSSRYGYSRRLHCMY